MLQNFTRQQTFHIFAYSTNWQNQNAEFRALFFSHKGIPDLMMMMMLMMMMSLDLMTKMNSGLLESKYRIYSKWRKVPSRCGKFYCLTKSFFHFERLKWQMERTIPVEPFQNELTISGRTSLFRIFRLEWNGAFYSYNIFIFNRLVQHTFTSYTLPKVSHTC